MFTECCGIILALNYGVIYAYGRFNYTNTIIMFVLLYLLPTLALLYGVKRCSRR